MCGRFALRLNENDILCDVNPNDWVHQDHFVPRYNIAPRSNAPVLRRRRGGRDPSGVAVGLPGDMSDIILHTMKWGLVPHWSKFEDKTLSTTNARSENLVEGGGMWDSIKSRKRCAVLCQGYYEWLTKGKEKLPHFVKPKAGSLMLLAGLYDSVVLEGRPEPLWTFTIVTTAASKEFSWLHDRQPVILSSPEVVETWLNTDSQTWSHELSGLLQPNNDLLHPLECYQVPKGVGKVGTESPTFIEPIASRKDGIQALFSRQKKVQTPRVNPSPEERYDLRYVNLETETLQCANLNHEELNISQNKTVGSCTPQIFKTEHTEEQMHPASRIPPAVKRERSTSQSATARVISDPMPHEREGSIYDKIGILDGPPTPKKTKNQTLSRPLKLPTKRRTVRKVSRSMDEGKITSFFKKS